MLKLNFSRDGVLYSDFEVHSKVVEWYRENESKIWGNEIVEFSVSTERALTEVLVLLKERCERKEKEILSLYLEGEPWEYGSYLGPEEKSFEYGWFCDITDEFLKRAYNQMKYDRENGGLCSE